MAKTPARSCSGQRPTPTLPAYRSLAGAIRTRSLIIRWCRRPPVRPAAPSLFFITYYPDDPAPPKEDENFAVEAQAHITMGNLPFGALKALDNMVIGEGGKAASRHRPCETILVNGVCPLPCKPNDPLCVDDPLPPPVVVDPIVPPRRRSSSSSAAAAVRPSAPLAACPKQALG